MQRTGLVCSCPLCHILSNICKVYDTSALDNKMFLFFAWKNCLVAVAINMLKGELSLDGPFPDWKQRRFGGG